MHNAPCVRRAAGFWVLQDIAVKFFLNLYIAEKGKRWKVWLERRRKQPYPFQTTWRIFLHPLSRNKNSRNRWDKHDRDATRFTHTRGTFGIRRRPAPTGATRFA